MILADAILAMALLWADVAAVQAQAPLPSEELRELGQMMGELRGIPLKDSVSVDPMTREESRAFLRRKLAEEYPPEAIAAEQATYRHFGLLGSGEDLESLFVELMVERAAGFYDPAEKRLFVVSGMPWPGAALAHEMAHALQDQSFGLEALLDSARGNDDRLRAVQAMIEGEAVWLAGQVSGRRAGSRLLSRLTLSASLDASRHQEPARPAPPFPVMLQAELSFPYVAGLAWAHAHATGPGGAARMNELFRHPPDSSEQILHPEKSRAPRDLPATPPDDILPDLASHGWRLVKGNTWGEFGVREVLGGSGAAGAEEASEGWDGDLYGVYESAAGATALVWLSVWDRPEDAAEFAAAAAGWLQRRGSDASSRVTRNGDRVLLIERLPSELASKVAGDLSASWLETAPRP